MAVAFKWWCKIVTSTAAKKRRDDVEILPFYYVNTEAAFTPYEY